ncbi:protein yellow-like [Macrosteles quadrilineatus]|uniref:protein yellow-like n=1 Tax=Macrosteles quadrilineatus TaxID=74068 RepID=UPI0023E21CCE|nr:protein yellow-like [Macrosteles quadrilineatus]
MELWTLVCLGLLPQVVLSINTRLTEVLHWTLVDYMFGSPQERQAALDSGRFVPQNNLALGVERWGDKLFITVPRFKSGVWSTLNYIKLDDKLADIKNFTSPPLIPYPNLEANTLGGEAKAWPPKLTSVVRVRADACDRLWVMDSAVIENNKQLGPPKLMIYDLKSDSLLFSYSLKDKEYNEKSLFPSITVDVTSANCDHAHVYLPDVYNYNLVVYSLQTNETHLVTHNYFHFDPLSGDFSSGKFHWQWQDGIFNLALSPVDREGYRLVYFHALASTMEFVVASKHLQNSSMMSSDSAAQDFSAFKVLGNRGMGGQSSAEFLDEETGVLFFTLVTKNAVGCWNSFKGDEYEDKSIGIIAQDEETMVFPNDLKVDKKGNLWVISSPLPEFFFGNLNPENVNFRVFMSPVRLAIKGTVCDEM